MVGSFSASWAQRANSQSLTPVRVEFEEVGHPVRERDGIVGEACVAVEHVLDRVVGGVADERLGIDRQPRLALGKRGRSRRAGRYTTAPRRRRCEAAHAAARSRHGRAPARARGRRCRSRARSCRPSRRTSRVAAGRGDAGTVGGPTGGAAARRARRPGRDQSCGSADAEGSGADAGERRARATGRAGKGEGGEQGKGRGHDARIGGRAHACGPPCARARPVDSEQLPRRERRGAVQVLAARATGWRSAATRPTQTGGWSSPWLRRQAETHRPAPDSSATSCNRLLSAASAYRAPARGAPGASPARKGKPARDDQQGVGAREPSELRRARPRGSQMGVELVDDLGSARIAGACSLERLGAVLQLLEVGVARKWLGLTPSAAA